MPLPTSDLILTIADGPNFTDLKSETRRIRLNTGEIITAEIIGAATLGLGSEGFLIIELTDVTNPNQPKHRSICSSGICEWLDNPVKKSV